jgi:hypothetical protein
MKRLVQGSVAALLGFLAANAIAQDCTHVVGAPWTDGFGYTWYLGQSGTSIAGSVNTNCGVWAVYGTMYGSSGFELTAYNPGRMDCNWWVRYDGYLTAGGCNVGSGSWVNDYFQNGTFAWQKACEVPSGETTSDSALWWADANGNEQDTTGEFFKYLATANNVSGPNLGGRRGREVSYADSADNCYFPNSNIPYQHSVTGGEFWINTNNQYGDLLGWDSTAIDYYRSTNRAPCNLVSSQRMQIVCNATVLGVTTTTWTAYKDEYLVNVIGLTGIAESRDSKLHSKDPYP